MFGLGFGELVIVAILALVLLGPDELPGAAKTIGKTLKDLKKATDGLKDQVEREMAKVERSIDVDDERKAPAVPPVAAAAMAASARQPAAVPEASRENVPGLDAAFVDPAPAPPPPAAPDPDKIA